MPSPLSATLGSALVSALSYIDHVADYMHTNQRLQDVPSPKQFPTEVPMYLPVKGWPGAKLGINLFQIKVHGKTMSKNIRTILIETIFFLLCKHPFVTFYLSDFGP